MVSFSLCMAAFLAAFKAARLEEEAGFLPPPAAAAGLAVLEAGVRGIFSAAV